ncbi:MAG: hypothetical protein SX243_12670 [Acidobacteriota bacterium]|nr:hypothetical protein [Acidobacteriota bacterium]
MSDTTPNDPENSSMKSAYELALEKMEGRGIERPRQDSLSEETRNAMAEVRSKAEARLAELEIMHRQSRGKAQSSTELEELERDYRAERQRIEEGRERKLEELRQGS